MSPLTLALPFTKGIPLPIPLELHLETPIWAHNPQQLRRLIVFTAMSQGIFVLTVWSMSGPTAGNMPLVTPNTNVCETTVLFVTASATPPATVTILFPHFSTLCCTRSARHGTLFPFPVLAPYFRPCADGSCRAVQARLCHKRCRYVIGLGPYLLSMTSSPSALVAVPGFSSFHLRFAPSDKRAFCHSSLVTLYPAPLSPLDDNSSIAWSVRALVQYI